MFKSKAVDIETVLDNGRPKSSTIAFEIRYLNGGSLVPKGVPAGEKDLFPIFSKGGHIQKRFRFVK